MRHVKRGMTLEHFLASGDTFVVDANPSSCTTTCWRRGYCDPLMMRGRVVYITFARRMATSTGVMVGSSDSAPAQAFT